MLLRCDGFGADVLQPVGVAVRRELCLRDGRDGGSCGVQEGAGFPDESLGYVVINVLCECCGVF